jgi:2-phospho-L-lactate guanylyltransferase
LRFARALGLEPIREQERDLNGALQTAMDWAAARADGHLLVLPDLPLLRPSDVRGIVAAGSSARAVVVCPDHARLGTNILFTRPCGVIPPLFGTGSFARHVEAACVAGITPGIFESPGTRRDLDTPDDFQALGLVR